MSLSNILGRLWLTLPCRLWGHIYYWDNCIGRICITCGHQVTPDWLIAMDWDVRQQLCTNGHQRQI